MMTIFIIILITNTNSLTIIQTVRNYNVNDMKIQCIHVNTILKI